MSKVQKISPIRKMGDNRNSKKQVKNNKENEEGFEQRRRKYKDNLYVDTKNNNEDKDKSQRYNNESYNTGKITKMRLSQNLNTSMQRRRLGLDKDEK